MERLQFLLNDFEISSLNHSRKLYQLLAWNDTKKASNIYWKSLESELASQLSVSMILLLLSHGVFRSHK